MDDASLAGWLALREAADAAVRSESLTRAIAAALASHDPIRIVDLATGTGSNIRYLMPRITGRQQWLAVDRSATLLAELPERISAWAIRSGYEVNQERDGFVVRGGGIDCQVQTRQLDLAVIPDVDALARPHLVTASALLDLVSESWLGDLAARCREIGAAALFTITYNGRSQCTPAEPEDELVLQLFNRHQRTDKGLGGPAAGPDAVAVVVQRFEAVGYTVRREASNWQIGPEQTSFQRDLIEGWAHAAAEIEPRLTATINDWRDRRLRHVGEGRSRLIVEHDDVAALPREVR